MADIQRKGGSDGLVQLYHDNGDGSYSDAVYVQNAGGATYFNVNLSTAVINTNNGTTNVVVPAISGRQFMPVFAALCCTGTPTVCTTVQLVEGTSGNVILSHVIADLATTVWAGPTGGTVVTTYLGAATTANRPLLITATGTLTTTTFVRGVVCGFFL
jgi:hypothetical protein